MASEAQKFHVENMNCMKCVRSITEAIEDVDPFAEVDCNLEAKEVEVQSDSETSAILSAIQSAGFEAKEA